MGLGGDRRGQSIQIGAVLLFGVLVLSLTTFQATIVPQENKEIEFNHNQRVQTDMLQLRDGVLGAAGTGTSQPVTVETGTRYPARTFLINPGPASGSLRTVELGTSSELAVSNAAAINGETGDYWDGSRRNYATGGFAYEPNYNEFDNAPTTVYENSVVYNRAPPEAGGGVVARSEQTVVDGRTISLVALQGEADRAAVEPISISPRPDSAPFRTVSVTDGGGAVAVELSTGLPETVWEDLLASELDPDTSAGDASDGDDRFLAELDCANAPPDPCGTLTLTFETGVTYDLRLAGVSVGSGSVSTAATYVTDVTGDDTSIPEGGSQKLVVEVRDQYNNPVSGVTTSVTTGPSDGSVTAISATTDEDGEAVFRYEAPGDVNTATDVDVELGFDGPDGDSTAGSSPEEEAVFDMTVMDADGGGSGGGSSSLNYVSGSGTAAKPPGSGSGPKSGIKFDVENTASGDIDVTAITVDSTSSTATEYTEGNGGDGRFNREVFFNVDASPKDRDDPADGYVEESSPIAIGDSATLDNLAQLSTGDDATVYMYEFVDSGGNSVDMSGSTVQITIEYEIGGSTETVTFDFTA